MAAAEVHVGDAGTIVRKTVKDGGAIVDVSSATTMDLVTENADGTRTTIAGAFNTDGTDGVIDFTSVAGTWTAAGKAREQVQLVLSSGSWSSNIVIREVGESL